MKPSPMILIGWVLIYLNTTLWIGLPASKSDEKADNQCVACHTDLKKLIRLCWKVEALKPKSLKSEESSGEG